MTAWNPAKTFESADRAISDGMLWRAKEILQGNIVTQHYDPELHERYGRVLLQMGDLVEAGKHLFLSGARCQEFNDAINLFIDKHRRDPDRIFHALPNKVKWVPHETFPTNLREEMRALGIDERQRRFVQRPQSSWKDRFISYTVVAGLLALLCCTVVGAIVILRAIWMFLTG